MKKLLQIENLIVHYEAVKVLKGINFDICAGEIVALIGPNGAGKTTTLRAISGLVKSSGKILYQNKNILGMAPHLIVKQGLTHAPEGRGVFLNLTVGENLDLGAWGMKNKKELKIDLEKAFAFFPRLKDRYTQRAGTLSGGELQMLSIARALMARPKLLLLDEPSLGLSPQMIEKIFEIIVALNQQGQSILLVEQNALQALQIAHRGLILETGNLVKVGTGKELLNSEEVRKAYLGEL